MSHRSHLAALGGVEVNVLATDGYHLVALGVHHDDAADASLACALGGLVARHEAVVLVEQHGATCAMLLERPGDELLALVGTTKF